MMYLINLTFQLENSVKDAEVDNFKKSYDPTTSLKKMTMWVSREQN